MLKVWQVNVAAEAVAQIGVIAMKTGIVEVFIDGAQGMKMIEYKVGVIDARTFAEAGVPHIPRGGVYAKMLDTDSGRKSGFPCIEIFLIRVAFILESVVTPVSTLFGPVGGAGHTCAIVAKRNPPYIVASVAIKVL